MRPPHIVLCGEGAETRRGVWPPSADGQRSGARQKSRRLPPSSRLAHSRRRACAAGGTSRSVTAAEVRDMGNCQLWNVCDGNLVRLP
jgi:hypothetical protein